MGRFLDLMRLHPLEDVVEDLDGVGDVRPLLSMTHSARSAIAASVTSAPRQRAASWQSDSQHLRRPDHRQVRPPREPVLGEHAPRRARKSARRSAR